jgi:16S rRNA (uracil1498-N3)-methyltransferase
MTLKDWFGSKPAEADAELVLMPGAAASLAAIDTPTNRICLLIGPEGGLSEIEYEDAAISGFSAVSLGPRVLRTETAAVAALSVLQSRWGDLA